MRLREQIMETLAVDTNREHRVHYPIWGTTTLFSLCFVPAVFGDAAILAEHHMHLIQILKPPDQDRPTRPLGLGQLLNEHRHRRAV